MHPVPHRLSARARRVPADHYIDEVCRRIASEKEEHMVGDILISPSWQGLAEIATEVVTARLDAEARAQRQHLPRMAMAVCLPPPQVLRAVRAGIRPLLGPHPKAVSKGHPQLANPIHRSLSARGMERIVRRLAREKGIKGADE